MPLPSWAAQTPATHCKAARRWEEIAKVDEELGLVFGWGIICKIDGQSSRYRSEPARQHAVTAA